MISEEQGRLIAEEYLQASRKPREPELAIDWRNARVKEGILIAPYNSSEFLTTGENQLLDCWPILVNLSSGQVRFGELEERGFWKTP
ncbi:hypothetical protein KMT30_03775 [Streptomyces sp. IBSBF 2953]|uniref:hypothetical protein n=1 Tax=Streptomyces TaxID=1883 RepID=UPI002119D9DF|nr:hypothetical protein [Streptomyces scabiei]MCQ9178171.1 hypothetical protein [Streptomyces hayashii]MDX3119247.1 hypothetical protein [Streptomyces scabiei]